MPKYSIPTYGYIYYISYSVYARTLYIYVCKLWRDAGERNEKKKNIHKQIDLCMKCVMLNICLRRR